MPMWRCPHCGTPQAETARCWVCRRSSTACGTCRNFRRSVAAELGYCGLDRGRQPLGGDEIRWCWEAGATPAEPAHAIRPAAQDAPRTRLEFIDVEAARPRAAKRAGSAAPLDEFPPGTGRPTHGEPGWSLWGDPDA